MIRIDNRHWLFSGDRSEDVPSTINTDYTCRLCYMDLSWSFIREGCLLQVSFSAEVPTAVCRWQLYCQINMPYFCRCRVVKYGNAKIVRKNKKYYIYTIRKVNEILPLGKFSSKIFEFTYASCSFLYLVNTICLRRRVCYCSIMIRNIKTFHDYWKVISHVSQLSVCMRRLKCHKIIVKKGRSIQLFQLLKHNRFNCWTNTYTVKEIQFILRGNGLS